MTRTRRSAMTMTVAVVALAAAGCGGSAPPSAPAAQAGTASHPPTVSTAPSATVPTVSTAPSVSTAPTPTSPAATATKTPTGGPSSFPSVPGTGLGGLPAGKGARIAIVVDDVGEADTYLRQLLATGLPLTFSVMPFTAHARADDALIARAGRALMLHIPLPIAGDHDPAGGLGLDASAADARTYVTQALARVPHAVGANNHEGSLGTSTPDLMNVLLPALWAHHVWFLDSVTAQSTVGYATALRLGMPSRINNVFLDNDAADGPARDQLLVLARLAARTGVAIGICHVTKAGELHALQQLAPRLIARGYRFVSVTTITNQPVGGLDVGVRTHL